MSFNDVPPGALRLKSPMRRRECLCGKTTDMHTPMRASSVIPRLDESGTPSGRSRVRDTRRVGRPALA